MAALRPPRHGARRRRRRGHACLGGPNRGHRKRSDCEARGPRNRTGPARLSRHPAGRPHHPGAVAPRHPPACRRGGRGRAQPGGASVGGCVHPVWHGTCRRGGGRRARGHRGRAARAGGCHRRRGAGAGSRGPPAGAPGGASGCRPRIDWRRLGDMRRRSGASVVAYGFAACSSGSRCGEAGCGARGQPADAGSGRTGRCRVVAVARARRCRIRCGPGESGARSDRRRHRCRGGRGGPGRGRRAGRRGPVAVRDRLGRRRYRAASPCTPLRRTRSRPRAGRADRVLVRERPAHGLPGEGAVRHRWHGGDFRAGRRRLRATLGPDLPGCLPANRHVAAGGLPDRG